MIFFVLFDFALLLVCCGASDRGEDIDFEETVPVPVLTFLSLVSSFNK
jgi:hypothetical protein